jgi:hypothetical protein
MCLPFQGAATEGETKIRHQEKVNTQQSRKPGDGPRAEPNHFNIFVPRQPGARARGPSRQKASQSAAQGRHSQPRSATPVKPDSTNCTPLRPTIDSEL